MTPPPGASFIEWMRRWDDAWESWTLEDVEVRGMAVIADYRDGRVTRLAYYNDQAAALADIEAG